MRPVDTCYAALCWHLGDISFAILGHVADFLCQSIAVMALVGLQSPGNPDTLDWTTLGTTGLCSCPGLEIAT